MKGLLIILLLVSACSALFPFEGEDWESGDIYMNNDGKGDTLFYYLMRARNKTAEKKLVIWLNGGPGATSVIGLLAENGPYMFNMKGEYNYNPYSWNNEYDVLYVDQPPGTGNSLVQDADHLCRDERCVGRNFYSFLTRFYEAHQEYKNKPLYITGESYGGHYVPVIAEYLLRANNPEIKLKGIAIGNGYYDEILQFKKDAFYLYVNNVINYAQAFISQSVILACAIALEAKVEPLLEICADADFVIALVLGVKNPYDIRANETYEKIMVHVENIMNDEKVKKALKAEGRTFNQNRTNVSNSMHRDTTDSSLDQLKYAVESGINVLLYYGDKDYICNWMGGLDVADFIEWKNAEKFRKAEYKDWVVDKQVTGKYKKVDNYMFLIVKDSGHMVPMNLPSVALELLRQFINNNFS